ncbi:hypothetical protein BUL40_11435 [Croceivirga radicis]|uniref:Anti-sigma factor n=1 Tax=Croceivirga radicis TaxID=1929488 RepID=A0A1V6LQA4_9FLAO|nr:hypothetical protein [Croceivirga radicis]OQD42371.1 hypothetical protein BUL40_11435 [Croceivirga radicis]
MAQDLREMFQKEREIQKFKLKEGHQERFLDKLDSALPTNNKKKTTIIYWLGIAATLVIALTAGLFLFNKEKPITATKTVINAKTHTENDNGISLGDLSPDLQKIETYYVGNINYELSKLEVSNENKEVVDGYMEQLAQLDHEYKELNVELNNYGPNEDTISALIQNLQLRLQLLQKLKSKLNQLKSSENEQSTII